MEIEFNKLICMDAPKESTPKMRRKCVEESVGPLLALKFYIFELNIFIMSPVLYLMIYSVIIFYLLIFFVNYSETI